MKIGINPLTWTNDDLPSLGSEVSLETCLEEAKKAGYQGVELGNKFPRDHEVLKPILDKYDLELASGWYDSKLLEHSVAEEIEVVKPHLDLLKNMGCKVMVFADTSGCVHGDINLSLSRRPKLANDNWQEFGKNLTEVAKYLKDGGVEMAYHYHMGTTVQASEDVDKLMENTGEEVGLLIDTGHMVYAGGDPVSLIKKYGGRINHVHLKDVRKEILQDVTNKKSSFLNSVLRGVFTVPGDGCIDFSAVLKELKKIDYSGWMVVEAEQDPAVATSFEYASKGFEYINGQI